MATVVQTALQFSEADVEQYCIADGLSLNTGGYAIRLYLNGHTHGSAILNDAAKEVLYPSATAHPFKIDSFMRANKSGGSMTISLQFGGTDVHSESSGWGTGLKDKTKEGISDSVVVNSSRSTEIKWHIKGSSTVSRFSIASTRLTFYFNQYKMRPLVGNNANGIQEATVSNASPYQGDTVVFAPKLVQGATWVGWYSDAACTNLVSTDQNYSVSPTSDLTLYAKATHDAELFICAAVAGVNISSVSVSDSIVSANGSCTFSATANTGCTFEGWYSDKSCTNLVSTENPYTATITADITLYANAHLSNLNISVGTSQYGTATVSASVVQYGNEVTFTATPTSQKYDFFGWYTDAAYTSLVSLDNPYNCTVTTDIKLYPKFGLRNYNLIVHPTGYDKINFSGATNIENVEILYKNSSKETSTDTVATWAIDGLNKSDNPASVGFFVDGAKFSCIPANATIIGVNVSMKTKTEGNTSTSIVCNTSRGFYTAKKEINGDSFSYVQIGTTTYKDAVIKLNEDSTYSYYLTYTISGEEAGEWTVADLKSGYFGVVWLASSPSITSNGGVSKHLIHNIDISISYTLPDESTTSTTLYFKTNGSYKSATRIYKKMSGAWVEQTDLPAIFSSESSGTASNYVCGGSV